MRNARLHRKYDPGKHWLSHPEAYVTRFMRRLPSAGLILEVGCDEGQDLARISSAGHRAIGIDIDLAALLRARRSDASLVAMDGTALGFRGGAFRAAYMINVIHYLEDPQKAMTEIHDS